MNRSTFAIAAATALAAGFVVSEITGSGAGPVPMVDSGVATVNHVSSLDGGGDTMRKCPEGQIDCAGACIAIHEACQ